VDPLSKLGEEVNLLLESLSSVSINGKTYAFGEFVLSTYIFWMGVALLLLAIVMYLAVKRTSLVPKGRLANAVEALTEFVRNDISIQLLGQKDGKKYFPFIGSIFAFILINNLVGLVPGARPGTGTMGVTVALSTTVFVAFNIIGARSQGTWTYIKSFSPHGVPFPINLVVWFIEVFSATLRIFTLAVRLFANMYAGHIILGIFATLTALFAEPLIEAITTSGHPIGVAAIGALPSIGWLILMTALYMLEVLVAFVQAYVFTMLTTVYIGLAAHEH
jgi:F-type H+-transporting ATPase subunit a